MTRYAVDGVAMARYLVDRLPPAADEVSVRAERGVDVLEAPTVAISEAVWTAVSTDEIVGVGVDTTPNAVLRGLVNDGPVRVAPADEQDLVGAAAGFGDVNDDVVLVLDEDRWGAGGRRRRRDPGRRRRRDARGRTIRPRSSRPRSSGGDRPERNL